MKAFLDVVRLRGCTTGLLFLLTVSVGWAGSHPTARDARDVALSFIRNQVGSNVVVVDSDTIVPTAIEEADALAQTHSSVSPRSGISHFYFKQCIGGLDVHGAQVAVHVSRRGRVIASDNTLEENGRLRANVSAPKLGAIEGVVGAARAAGIQVSAGALVVLSEETDTPRRRTMLAGGALSAREIPLELVYVPATDGSLRLAWHSVLFRPQEEHCWSTYVDAVTGEVLIQRDWVKHADYNVLALPNVSPLSGNRSIVTDPADATASPFGWHDDDGVAGPEYTFTWGNNVHAQEDRDADDAGGHRPDGGAGLVFDFPLDLTKTPQSYEDASIVNLFYVNNMCHDLFYRYGFDEASGNFQTTNYTGLGLGEDAVSADAQDGSGFNNAWFMTLPEGYGQPKMTMYLWNMTTPQRDGSLANEIVIHEYGHGVSTRLVGGPSNADSLQGLQSGGMGEGWSDWWALCFTATAADGGDTERGIGQYALGQPMTGVGIRHHPYTTNMVVNPLTYGNIRNTFGSVHHIGEHWCSALWDMYWNMVSEHGFDPDFHAGIGGNNMALTIVTEALKLTPSSPTFLEARDAILLADDQIYAGANRRSIWLAFARRGMGVSADDGGDHNTLAVTEAFDLPLSITTDRLAYQSTATVSVVVEDIANSATSRNVIVELYENDFVSLSARGTRLATSTVEVYSATAGVLLTNAFVLPDIFDPDPEHGDMLVLTYTGTAGTAVYATAPIDDIPPVVTNIRAENVTDRDAEIVWDTDEATDEWVWFGTTLPPPTTPEYGSSNFTGFGSGATTYEHRVSISGLSELIVYHAGLRCADPAGNGTLLPTNPASAVESDYCSFMTPWRVALLSDDMEDGAQRWTTGGYSNEWEHGEPRGGPGSAASGKNCWGTDLDSTYPAPINAWLISQPIPVKTGTRLACNVWYEFPGFGSTDHGVIEVNNGHGWINVTPGGKFTSQTYSWQAVDLDLSAFDSSTIRIRFRIEGDGTEQTEFGYYVDDVEVTTLSPPGVRVVGISAPLDDDPAYAAANNGDGSAQFGETVKLSFQVMNMTPQVKAGVYATVSTPNEFATVMPEVARLKYGTLASAGVGWSDVPVTVSITDVPGESVLTVPLFHTAFPAEGGTNWTDVVELQVNRYYSLSGTVRNSLGEPIGDATVKLSGWGAATITTTSDPVDGSYLLDGLVAAQRYTMDVTKPDLYIPLQERIVGGSTTNKDVVLSRAFVDPIPTALAVTVAPGASTQTTLTLANTNALADRAARFALSSSFDAHATLSVAFPMGNDTIELLPGASTSVTVTVTAGATPNAAYNGSVDVENLDGTGFVGAGDLAVPLTITVDGPGIPTVELIDIVVSDTDADGDPEPGETLRLDFVVRNGGTAALNDLMAGVSVSGAATMIQTGMVFTTSVAPGVTVTGNAPVTAVIDADAVGGDTAVFNIQFADSDGRTWTSNHTVTVDGSLQISGTVTDTNGAAVVGLGVLTWTPSGTIMQATTDAAGDYALTNLPPATYRVMVARLAGQALSAVQTVPLLTADVAGVDFVIGALDITFGPAAFDFSVEEGRAARLALTVTNATGQAIRVSPRAAEDMGTSFAPASLGGAPGGIAPASLAPRYPVVAWDTLSVEDADLESLIVHLEPAAQGLSDAALSAELGLSVTRRFSLIPACVVQVPAGSSAFATAASFATQPLVRHAEPNYRLYPDAILAEPRTEPDDPDYLAGTLWGMDNQGQDGGTKGFDIDAPEAWSLTQGSTSIVVCVVDTGVNYNHTDLADNMWHNPGESGIDTNGIGMATNGVDDDGNGYIDDVYGINAIAGVVNPADPMDDHGHGTHCAGTIGAVGNNGIGVVGVNWRTRIMACKFLPAVGGGSTEDAIVALEYAIMHGARVVNNSWGGGPYNAALAQVMEVAASSNVLMMCAAGNDGVNNDSSPHYPSSYTASNIISVAASDRDGKLASFSNYGATSVDIAAPGVDIWSTSWLGSYASMSGTSMATPHAAGVATLVWGYLGEDATWDKVRDALYRGIVEDPAYAGIVSQRGHLNAFYAMATPNPAWMAFDPADKTIPAAGSGSLDVVANPSLTTAPGHYYAHIQVDALLPESAAIPVHLAVTPAPFPEIAQVTLDDTSGGDGDGIAEPGETVDVIVSLINSGSLLLPVSAGALSTAAAGVSLDTPTTQWPMIEGGDTRAAQLPATVRFGSSVSGPVTFRLSVDDGVRAPWTNGTFTIDVGTSYAIGGRVTSAETGGGIAGARVELIGGAGRAVTTDASGFFQFSRIPSGTFRARAMATGYTRSGWQRISIDGADASLSLPLEQVVCTHGPSAISAALPQGTDLSVGVVVTNTGFGTWQSDAYKLTPMKVLLLSDNGDLDGVAGVVSNLGARVTVLSDNATAGYSGNLLYLSPYDVVIADFSGSDGSGRELSSDEGYALYDYVWGGGRLVLTGVTPITSGNSFWLEFLFDVSPNGLLGTRSSQGQITDTGAIPNGPFAVHPAGVYVPVTEQVYENLIPDFWGSTPILTVDGAIKVSSSISGPGEGVLWTGNANGSEWTSAGVLQDLFKNLLFDWMHEDNVDWVDVPAGPHTAQAGSNATVTVRINGAFPGLGEASTEQTILLVGNCIGMPDVAIPLTASVKPRKLTVSTDVGVKDWLGQPIRGNGDVGSSLFQLLYAGADGLNNPPRTGGAPSGDDIVLLTALSSEPFSRFGTGAELLPDFGRFIETFGLSRLEISQAYVYIRAWDAGAFADAVAYGDSALYRLQGQIDESWVAEGWTVDQAIGYPGDTLADLTDHDGDSIPDGWNVMFGLSARRPVTPLVAQWTQTATVGAYGSGANQFSTPSRVAISSNHVFVADMWNHRIQVWDRALSTLVTTYGGVRGSGDGQLNQPAGLAYDQVTRRLAIADSGNHRVVVLDVDPTTAALSAVTNFGAYGSEPEQFNASYDVAFTPSSRILVADTLLAGAGNNRIQLFGADSTFVRTFGAPGSGAGQLDRPFGVFASPDGLVYVADADNNRVQCFGGSGSALWQFGTEGTAAGAFRRPYDSCMDPLGRLLVVDNQNHRIQLLDISTFGLPNPVATFGSYGAGSGELSAPQSVAMGASGSEIYVADTLNHRVVRMQLSVDVDADGMDDYWEHDNGLDGTDPSDALIDSDGDGVLNVGEYRLGTNPHLRDSNGDGFSDGWALVHAADPLASFPPHVGVHIDDADLAVPGDVLRWNASAGALYKVELSLDLPETEWVVQDTVTVSQAATVLWTNTTPPVANKYFYRIRQEL